MCSGTTGLPVDPSLLAEGGSASPTLTPLHSISAFLSGLSPAAEDASKTTVLVAEGLPPIAARLLEKIRRWEYVDLATLLHDPSSKLEEYLLQQQGQVVLVQSVEQAQKKKKSIFAISSPGLKHLPYCVRPCPWTQLLRRRKLWTHCHLINRLSRDLGGSLSLAYYMEYRVGSG